MSVRNLIKQSNVTLICTTDDPIDSLEWHKKLAADDTFDVKVLPAWRPDKAMNIEKPDYLDYLEKLAAAAGMTEINSFASLKEALKNRMAFFASMGCNVSDHALEYVMYYPASDDELEEIFLKRLNKMVLTKEEELKFKTAFMLFVGKEPQRQPSHRYHPRMLSGFHRCCQDPAGFRLVVQRSQDRYAGSDDLPG